MRALRDTAVGAPDDAALRALDAAASRFFFSTMQRLVTGSSAHSAPQICGLSVYDYIHTPTHRRREMQRERGLQRESRCEIDLEAMFCFLIELQSIYIRVGGWGVFCIRRASTPCQPPLINLIETTHTSFGLHLSPGRDPTIPRINSNTPLPR